MHAMWVTLKENMTCGRKLTDVVIGYREKYGKKILGCELHQVGNPFHGDLFSQSFAQTKYHELSNGDPARNITKMIFQRAVMNPSKPKRKIERIIRVKNSLTTLERYERYGEKVKKKAYEQYKKHPRTMVDGNEVLRFYGTPMSRYGEKKVYEPCKDPGCQVCRIIQSNFDTDYTKKKGIRLTTSSEEFSDKMTRIKHMKRAVIVCRTTAGRVANNFDHGVYEECDSILSEAQHSKSENLIVRNPSAALPCFVIVFS